MTATPSKGIREFQKERTKELVRLKREGVSYKEIADRLCMDKSNVRRTYLKELKNG